MPLYQGELKTGKKEWLASMCVEASDENAAAVKLGVSRQSFAENFVESDDGQATEACRKSMLGMAEGTLSIGLRAEGKVKYVTWLPVSDYQALKTRALDELKR